MSKVFATAADAVADIPSGASLAVGGFGLSGIPDELIKAIEAGVKSKSWEEALKKNEWMNTWQSGDEYKNYVDTEIKRIGEILAGLGLGKK